MKTVLAAAVLILPIAAGLTMQRIFQVPDEYRGRPGRPRLLAAVLGLVLLAALVAGTLWTIPAVYDRPSPSNPEALLPTKPHPPFPPDGSPEEGTERFLVTILIVEEGLGLERLVHLIDQIDVRFPEESGEERRWTFDAFGRECRLQLTLDEPRAIKKIGLHFGYRLQYSFGSWSGGGSVAWNVLDQAVGSFQEIAGLPIGSGWSLPAFSLVPERFPRSAKLGLFALRLAPDDPLRKVSFDEFALETGIPERIPGREKYGSTSLNIPTGGFVLAAHSGFSTVLLLIAGLLIVQAFPRRFAVLPVVLAVLVLIAAALDRHGLAVHMGRLEDPAATLSERALAADSLPATFFFRKTARASARGIAEDAQAPEPLREHARAALDGLSRW
jgi:hypothetical protein